MSETNGVHPPSTPANPIHELILQLARQLVEQKDAVTVEEKRDELGTTLVLTVAPTDLVRVIGKHGRTVRSLRTLLRVACRNLDQPYTLDVLTTPAP